MKRGIWKRSVLCAAFGVLAIAAPAGAGGRNDVYSGPIDQAPVPGFPHEPKIELYVHTQHHRDGRSKVKITHINIYDVTLHCENGKDVGAGEGRGNTDTVQVVPRYPIALKSGSFNEPRGPGEEGELVAIKGSVSKRNASGTLSVSDDLGDSDPQEAGEQPEHFGTCRSGALHWSATRG